MGRLQLTLLMVLAASLSVIACTPSRPPATPEPQFTTTPDPTVRSVIQQLQQLERQLDQMVATAEPAVPTATEEPTATELPVEAQAAGEPVRVTVFATRTPRPITAADAQPCSLGQVNCSTEGFRLSPKARLN